MPTMNMIQALNDAHKVIMRADDDVVVFGEDPEAPEAGLLEPEVGRRR